MARVIRKTKIGTIASAGRSLGIFSEKSVAGDHPTRFCQRRTRGQQWVTLAAALILTVSIAQRSSAQVTIQVNTTQQGVTNGQCSLQEAIYSSEFKSNKAVGSTDPDTLYDTGCIAGTGNGDTISLLPGAVYTFDHAWDGDAHNVFGPTATPVIFSKITIEGNGATLQWQDTFSPRVCLLSARSPIQTFPQAPGISRSETFTSKDSTLRAGMVGMAVAAAWARVVRFMSPPLLLP
jgi:hypothetical protein